MLNMHTACDTAHVKSLLWLPKHVAVCFGGARVPTLHGAALQVVRILSICETFHEIQVPLNFLFKFTEINLVLVNIKPVEFCLI